MEAIDSVVDREHLKWLFVPCAEQCHLQVVKNKSITVKCHILSISVKMGKLKRDKDGDKSYKSTSDASWSSRDTTWENKTLNGLFNS